MFYFPRPGIPFLLLVVFLGGSPADGSGEQPNPFRIATFQTDVTIPIGHRCMGVLPTKSRRIVDPLEARGFVLLGGAKPVVVVAVDWCEIRNGAYDQWRDVLADAASTPRSHVLVTSLHQHDAPVTDAGAAGLLAEAGLSGELYDTSFHAHCLTKVSEALKRAMSAARPVTHIGTGMARVERIGSSRRVVRPDGRVTFARGSRSATNEFYRDAPEGRIDPFLRSLTFFHDQTPLVVLSVYATHPMSYYGRGDVSADFVGLARRKRQRETPGVFQIYASGCSGDVTAGKYNDGSERARGELVDRLHRAMVAASENSERHSLQQVRVRTAKYAPEYTSHKDADPERLRTQLADANARTEDRILAAMGLSSFSRVEAGQAIDLPCIDLGAAQLLLFPGEAFVGYQLLAQELRPDSFVVSMGYGECWPGYIPTKAAFADGFHDKWLWVAPGADVRLEASLREVLRR